MNFQTKQHKTALHCDMREKFLFRIFNVKCRENSYADFIASY